MRSLLPVVCLYLQDKRVKRPVKGLRIKRKRDGSGKTVSEGKRVACRLKQQKSDSKYVGDRPLTCLALLVRVTLF